MVENLCDPYTKKALSAGNYTASLCSTFVHSLEETIEKIF